MENKGIKSDKEILYPCGGCTGTDQAKTRGCAEIAFIYEAG
jgi:hypothetical protein